MILVASECERRWNEDYNTRLQAAKDAYFGRSDYIEKSTLVRQSRGQDTEALEDVEYSRREMAGMDPDDESDAPTGVRLEVPRPYRVKRQILTDVSDWASETFGKPVSVGVVEAAWDIRKKVDADDV